MSAARSRELIGLVDTSGISVGFLVPVFAGGGGNAPVVQVLDSSGTVVGFEPYEVPEAPRLPSPSRNASVGAPGLHAFAFARDDVVLLSGNDENDQLAGRIEDPLLLNRPMLGMELADLLGRRDMREKFAAQVHSDMARTSVDAADRWRDLSVLTTDLRRELVADEAGQDRYFSTVVTRVHDGRILLLGLPEHVPGVMKDDLRRAVLAVVGRLARLYPSPRQGWRIVFDRPRSPAASRRPDAALLVATRDGDRGGLRGPWPPVPDVVVHHDARDLFSSDPEAFTRSLMNDGAPLFVVHDADDREAAPKAERDWSSPHVHGIGVGSPRACTLAGNDDLHQATTFIPVTGIRGASGSERNLVNAIRLAIAVEVEQRRRGHWPSSPRTLLRSRVARPAGSKYAWAALYDKAWAMGLAPWSALRIMPSTNASCHPDPVAEALLGGVGSLDGGLIDETLGTMPHTLGLLVDSSPRSQKDEVRHKRSVTRLLAQQQWGVTDQDFRRAEGDISIRGRLAEFEILTAPTAAGLGNPDRDRKDLFQLDIRQVRTIMVTCAASPTAVLEELADTGVLQVDVRDLVDFDAAHSNAVAILGSQLRRMVTGLPSRTRTQFIAFAAMQAFIADRVSGADASDLLAMLEGARRGKDFHLLLRSLKGSEGASTFEVRTFNTIGNRASEPHLGKVDRFRMSLAPEGVSIVLPAPAEPRNT